MTEDLKLLYKYLLIMNGKIDEVQKNDIGEYNVHGSYEQEFLVTCGTTKSSCFTLRLFYLTLKPMEKN